jgi:flagellar biosynthesis protein FlhG
MTVIDSDVITGMNDDFPRPKPAMDQATHLREIARRMKPRAQTIAITSGKGGVGKTNLSVNLATVLAALNRRVVLLDADMGLANADILCNVQPRYNLAHVVAGQKRMADVVTPVPAGFSLVAGASGLARMADLTEKDRARILSELETLQDSADVLIVDTGAGIGKNVLAFAAAADDVVVVTTPEPTAITDAYAVIKVLVRGQSTARVSIMVNQVGNRDEAKLVFDRIAGVCRQFLKTDVTFGGFVVSDPAVSESVRNRLPFVQDNPKSPASQCIMAWANRMDGVAAVPQLKEPFFRRVARWWK